MEELEYNQKEVTDVHTAYSRLKKELYKAQGGAKPVGFVQPNAGYLKKTVATYQQSKTTRIQQELLMYSLENNSKFRKCIIVCRRNQLAQSPDWRRCQETQTRRLQDDRG